MDTVTAREGIRGEREESLREVLGGLLARARREARVPGGVCRGDDRERLPRRAHPGGVRGHGSGARRHVRHPGGDQPLRRERAAGPRAGVHDGDPAQARLRGAEEGVPPEDRQRRDPSSGLRRDRARGGDRHDLLEDDRQAKPDGDRYVVNGRKIYISRVQHSDYMVLLARTTPRDQVKRKSEGSQSFSSICPRLLATGSRSTRGG